MGRKFGDEKEVKEKDLVKAENTKMDSGVVNGTVPMKQSRAGACGWGWWLGMAFRELAQRKMANLTEIGHHNLVSILAEKYSKTEGGVGD